MKIFAPLLRKFCRWSIRRAIRKGVLGCTVWVWFPNVNRCFKMRVSSFKASFFAARFVNPDDYDKSKADVDYGQIDNDIIINSKTFQPAKRL